MNGTRKGSENPITGVIQAEAEGYSSRAHYFIVQSVALDGLRVFFQIYNFFLQAKEKGFGQSNDPATLILGGSNFGSSMQGGLKITNVWLIGLPPQSTGGCGVGKEDSPLLSQGNFFLILGLSFKEFSPSNVGPLLNLGTEMSPHSSQGGIILCWNWPLTWNRGTKVCILPLLGTSSGNRTTNTGSAYFQPLYENEMT